MLQHNNNNNFIDQQDPQRRPIKHDEDSQALPSDEDIYDSVPNKLKGNNDGFQKQTTSPNPRVSENQGNRAGNAGISRTNSQNILQQQQQQLHDGDDSSMNRQQKVNQSSSPQRTDLRVSQQQQHQQQQQFKTQSMNQLSQQNPQQYSQQQQQQQQQQQSQQQRNLQHKKSNLIIQEQSNSASNGRFFRQGDQPMNNNNNNPPYNIHNQPSQQQYNNTNYHNTTYENDTFPGQEPSLTYNNMTYTDQPLVTPPPHKTREDLLENIDLNSSNHPPRPQILNFSQNNNNNNHTQSQQQQQQQYMGPTGTTINANGNNSNINRMSYSNNYNSTNNNNNNNFHYQPQQQQQYAGPNNGISNSHSNINYNYNNSVRNTSVRYANDNNNMQLGYQSAKNTSATRNGAINQQQQPQQHSQTPNKYASIYAYQPQDPQINLDDTAKDEEENIPDPRQVTTLSVKKLTPLEIMYLRQAQKMLDTQFFYSKLPINYYSFIVPVHKRPVEKFLFIEYFLPQLFACGVLLLLWGVQKEINDFCFYENGACECSNYGTKVWTFVRQMLSWKLGLIAVKKVVLLQIISEKQKQPYLEILLIYGGGLLVDYFMVTIIGLTADWQFYVAMFAIGAVVTSHSMKLKDLSNLFAKGYSLFAYDLNILGMLAFAYYALPAIYNSLIDHHSFDDAKNTFIYLYPLLECVMELLTNTILDRASIGEFFEYQMNLFILGMRVGVMTSVSASTFQFWYLGVLFMLKRILESTGLLYIQLRKIAYYMVPPNLQYFASMKEIPQHIKGREGYYLETIIWLPLFYWWRYTETLIPGYVKNHVMVDDCKFSASSLFTGVAWERAFFCWIFIFGGQALSVILNHNFRFDTIKWLGASKFSFLENAFIRLFGWYLFQLALGVSYAILNNNLQAKTVF